MASESVEILIEADNRASAKFKELNKDVDASVKQIKEVGGQSKASTELVGSLANSLGGSAIGGFAGEIAMLTERISAFSEVSKAGGAGALAFRAGLAGVAAVVAFKVGNAIGNVIFQTEKWREELERAKVASDELNQSLLRTTSKSFSIRMEEFSLLDPEAERAAVAGLLDEVEQQIADKNAQIKAKQNREETMTEAWFATPEEREQARDTTDLEAQLNLLREQRDALRDQTSERRQAIEAAKALKAEEDKSEAFVQTLRDELELLRATKEEQIAIQAARGTANNDDRTEAEQLLRERDAILAKKEAEKAAEAERKRMAETRAREAEAERKRIESVKSGIVDKLRREAVALKDGQVAARAYALEMQGIEKGLANQIAQTEALLGQKSKDIDLGVNATQGRLITRGRSDSIASKTEKNTAEIAKEMKRLADLLERNPSQKIELKQGGV